MNMNKTTKIIIAIASLLMLTACSVNTTSGGEDSVMNYVSTSEYSIPSSIKEKIEAKKKTIVITEYINEAMQPARYSEISVNVSNFINSAQAKMSEENYELISSDTNSMGEYGKSISVTLIFQKQEEQTAE